MTLKDKLEVEIMDLPLTDDVVNAIGIELEQIAEYFAIGFAEWIWGNCFNIFNDRFLYKDDEYSTKELLEIYKETL